LNFLTNAVKFTEAAEILLTVELGSEGSDSLRIAVADTGIGIPAEAQGKLFQDFTQVDASTTRKYGGTGLGLAISKLLVEHMGGQVGVESTEGAGSTSWLAVCLPLGAAGNQEDRTPVFPRKRGLVCYPGREPGRVALRGTGGGVQGTSTGGGPDSQRHAGGQTAVHRFGDGRLPQQAFFAGRPAEHDRQVGAASGEKAQRPRRPRYSPRECIHSSDHSLMA